MRQEGVRGKGAGPQLGLRHTSPSIDSSTPIISSSDVRMMRLDECDSDSISTFRPCESKGKLM